MQVLTILYVSHHMSCVKTSPQLLRVSSTCQPKKWKIKQRSAACVQAAQLFIGHFCSIITSLTVSPDSQYIVSTDRDHKIRVSNMPSQPMQVCIITFSI